MLFLCSFLILAISSVVNTSPVVYGKNALQISQYPFLVRLDIAVSLKNIKNGNKIRHVYECGGTIIGKRTILTAAHCVSGKVLSITVYAGSVFKDIPAQKLNWQGMLRNPVYNTTTYYGDIAIVWVQKDFDFTNKNKIRPAVLAATDPKAGDQVTYVGWGITEKTENPNILQEGSGKVLTIKECPDDGDICVRSTNKIMNICDGDSGGPLVNNGVVIGVASAISHDEDLKKVPAYKLCNGKTPAIFVNIFKFKDWIHAFKNTNTSQIK